MNRRLLPLFLLLLLPARVPALTVSLAWDAAVPQAGQVAPEGYVLTRNGVEVLRTTATRAPDTLPAPGTATYTVQATAQGRLSAASNAVEVTAQPLTCTSVTLAGGFTLACLNATPVVPPGPYPLRPVGSLTASADSAETVGESGRASNAVDGLPGTLWHTQWQGAAPPLPHTLTLDLGAVLWVDGLSYTPRPGGGNGTLTSYRVETAPDGTTWTPAAAGTWAYDASAKVVRFAAVPARSVRLVGLASGPGQPWASAAEVGVYAVEGTP